MKNNNENSRQAFFAAFTFFMLVSTIWSASLVSASANANANESKKSAEKPSKPKIQKSVTPTFKEDYQKYCFNNVDAVAEAKFAWQAKTISEMEAKLKTVITKLEVKQKEYQSWVTRRENFISKMTTSLVKIYSSMEPEAAAAQISIVDYDTAVSILTKLKPREASAILNEMDPKRASQLVRVIVGSIATEPEEKN